MNLLYLEPEMGTETLSRYLGENVRSVEKAGEGNMNCVLRVRTDDRSLIMKQSRPYVEKYKTIPAPEERALMEAAFYDAVAEFPDVAGKMPPFLGVDREAKILMLGDLGAGVDYTGLYKGEQLASSTREELLDYLEALHGARSEKIAAFPDNRRMRELNHHHIFVLPGDELKKDPKYRAAVERLGNVYMSQGTSLLHGDYYPGSWLKTSEGTRVIDPEFGFVGPPEFDLGVMMAHMIMAQQDQNHVDAVFMRAKDKKLALGFAGVEIMRRLLGVAKLPLPKEDPAWLPLSTRLILEGA